MPLRTPYITSCRQTVASPITDDKIGEIAHAQSLIRALERYDAMLGGEGSFFHSLQPALGAGGWKRSLAASYNRRRR